MKQTPKEEAIQVKMQPGVITLEGFLGQDNRHYHDIIFEDEQQLSILGITAEDIATRMQYFTDKSYEAFSGTITVDEIYEVETEVVRGKLPCPFSHPGIYRKTMTVLFNKKNNITVRWTALNIHLIREHHFFEGIGSKFRLEPNELIKAIY